MLTRKLLIASAVAGVLVGAAALTLSLWKVPSYEASKSTCPDFSEGRITAGKKQLSVSVAATDTEQARGLGGCPEIPEDSGMLFPYAPAQPATFWMKDMLIPIDIVWIRSGEVVGIEKNAPAPTPGTPESLLPLYRSPGPVDNVLEIKAGGAGEYGLEAGSEVSISD